MPAKRSVERRVVDDLEALYRAHATTLHDYLCQVWHAPSEEAQDVVHDVFTKIMRGGLPPVWDLKPYLFVAVRNRWFDLLRRTQQRTRALELALPNLEPASGDATSEVDLRTDLMTAFDRLPLRRREVFWLYIRGDLSYKAIAAALQISPNTVNKHLRRARLDLRQSLGEEWSHESQ